MSRLDGQGLIRYDREIMDMVDMVQQEWGAVNTERFALAGFSGGAQVRASFSISLDRGQNSIAA